MDEKMEAPLENGSNSNSFMAIDKSDTNQSIDGQKLIDKDSIDCKNKELEEDSLRYFSGISKIRDISAMDTNETDQVVSLENKTENSAIHLDEDYDLAELNSEVLSKQMSNVVTQLEKQVLDDSEKKSGHQSAFKKRHTYKTHPLSIDLTEDIEADNGNIKEQSDIIKDVNEELDGKDSVDGLENPSTSQENMFNDVQIKVIDVPDDDDLFDFLKKPGEPDLTDEISKHLDDFDETSNCSDTQHKQEQEDIQKRELYRFLTANDPTLIQSNEVTPYQSGDEHKSDSESSGRSALTEDLSSESENDHEEDTVHQQEQVFEEMESRPETPVDEESYVETPVRVRRKPGRKPQTNKPPKKPKLAPGELTEKTLERLEKCKTATHKWLKDLEVPEQLSLEKTLRFDIVDLNQYLTCELCKGYLYEASTITECMHTFCKNCIVRHCMEVSLHCPVCNILIHPTDPFVHIRLDRMIQDIVYKILPNVAETEMKNIEAFYRDHPEDKPKEIKEEPVEEESPPKEKEVKPARNQSQMVSLLLESESDTTEYDSMESLEKKFIRVTGSATVANVCEFLKKKLSLDISKQVELFCCGDTIEEDNFTLEKIKNKFFGVEDCLMLLQYRIRET